MRMDISDRFSVHYINLDSRPDRDEYMRAQFERLGLSASRLRAITPLELDAAPIGPHGLRPADRACIASHKAAWTAFLATGKPFGLVFEDDAVLSPRLPAFLAALDMGDLDLLRIEVAKRIRILPAIAHYDGVAIHPFRSTLIGSCGYVISRGGAEYCLENLIETPVDVGLFSSFHQPGRGVRSAVTSPGLCTQWHRVNGKADLGRSDIQLEGEHARWMAPSKHIASRLFNVWDHLVYLPSGLKRSKTEFDATSGHQQGGQLS